MAQHTKQEQAVSLTVCCTEKAKLLHMCSWKGISIRKAVRLAAAIGERFPHLVMVFEKVNV